MIRGCCLYSAEFLILISTWAGLFLFKCHFDLWISDYVSVMAHSSDLLTHSWSLIHTVHSMLITAYPLLLVMFLACVNIWLSNPSYPYLFVIPICSLAVWHTYLMKPSICSPPTCDVNLFFACVYVSCCPLIYSQSMIELPLFLLPIYLHLWCQFLYLSPTMLTAYGRLDPAS